MTRLSPAPEDDIKQTSNITHQFGLTMQEEDSWEDIPEEGSAFEDQPDSQPIFDKKLRSRSITPLASPLRRRKLKTVAAGTSNSRRTIPAPQTPKRKQPQREIPTDDIIDGAVEGALFTGRYMLDVSKTAIHLMRIPLGLLLFTLLLSLCMRYTAHYLQKTVAPFCFLPLINRMTMCEVLLHQPITKLDPWRELIETQTKTFDQLLDDSVGGSSLSLEVKKAEMATSDLVTVVRYSDLRVRDALATSLKEFVDDARKTGRGLQKLSAKVGGAVDNILAVNAYAARTIEEANAKKPSVLSALTPWSKNPKAVVASTFAETMGVLDANLNRLILEAESNVANLNVLEERLMTLHEMITREGIVTDTARDELLSNLWIVLFGGGKELKKFENNLKLLKELGSFRKKAFIHVTAALETLRGMSDEMEDLRERVATPGLVGPSIPVEVHIQSIQYGIERLQEGREKAKGVEADAVRRVLGGGQETDD